MPQLRRYSPTKLWDGSQMAIFGRYFASCIFSGRRLAVYHISTHGVALVRI